MDKYTVNSTGVGHDSSEKSDSVELQTLRHRSMELEHTLSTQTALVQCLLNCARLDGLTHKLAELLHCIVVVENKEAAILSVGYFAQDAAEQGGMLRAHLSAKNYSLYDRLALSEELHHHPISITENISGQTVFRLIDAIDNGTERFGYLSCLRENTSFADDELSVVHSATEIFAVQMTQDKKVAEIELRLKGNFIEDLISTNYSDLDSILNRARALDYDISLPHRVLVAEIENLDQLIHHQPMDQDASATFKIELAQFIQKQLNLHALCMVIYHNDEIVLLVQQKDDGMSIDTVKNLSEQIIKSVSAQFMAKLYIGIGSICHELTDYPASYLSAKKALEIGAYMITEGQVRSFEQFKVHALFLSTLKPAELYNYARSQVGALLDYDKTHHTELLKTLQEFLYLRNNVDGTARTINMSVSGLKYRLQKIEKIIGYELKDYKVSFDLQLALIILQLFGEYSIRN